MTLQILQWALAHLCVGSPYKHIQRTHTHIDTQGCPWNVWQVRLTDLIIRAFTSFTCGTSLIALVKIPQHLVHTVSWTQHGFQSAGQKWLRKQGPYQICELIHNIYLYLIIKITGPESKMSFSSRSRYNEISTIQS